MPECRSLEAHGLFVPISHNLESSPERSHDQAPRRAQTASSPEAPSVYYSDSQHYKRSQSPDTISEHDIHSDDDKHYQELNPSYLQQPRQDFSFSSRDNSFHTTSVPNQQQTLTSRPSSRRRPSPPAFYTPPLISSTYTRDFAQSKEQIPQLPTLAPPTQASVRRVTIGSRAPPEQNVNQAPAPSMSALEPPIQFLPPTGDRAVPYHHSPLTSASPNYEDITASSGSPTHSFSTGATLPVHSRGRTNAVEDSYNIDSERESPERRRQESQNGSKDRFAEQSAREREERRARAQKRMSTGRQNTDFS